MDTTLLKGLRVLEALVRADGPRGPSELARELELTRSNTHRTLQTLTAAGYTRQVHEGAGYECTLKLFELAAAVMERVDIRRAARPHIEELAKRSGETVHLAALDGREVIYLDKVESDSPIRAYSHLGGRAPAHCVASGKALLAWVRPDWLEHLLVQDLERSGDASISDPARLRRDLNDVRTTGCAVNHGEWRSSVGGIASVVCNAQGTAEAAIGVSGPVARILRNEQEYRQMVLSATRAVTNDVGGGTFSATVSDTTAAPPLHRVSKGTR